jgi:two-component system, sensor histidine kinase PdtaS
MYISNYIWNMLFTAGVSGLAFFAPTRCWAQLVDLGRDPPYQQVFVETDDFDTAYLAELEAAYYQTKESTLRLALINDLAYYWHTRNLNQAAAFARQGLALAAAADDRLAEGRLQISLGAILLRDEMLDSAELVLNQAIDKVLPADLPLLYTQLGYVAERRGQLGIAADYALKCLQLGEELPNQKAIALAYSDLSNLFWKQGKFDQGIQFGLKSEEVFINRGLRDMDYSFTLYVIGNSYLENQQYDKALDYYQSAIEMSEQYGFYNNLADVYISIVDLYTLLEHYPQAEDAAAKAIYYSELLDNNFLLMRSWLSLGKLQNLRQQPREALQSIQTCMRVATAEFGDKFFLHQAYRELGKAYAALGDYQNAYAAFGEYDQLKDSVFTAEADERIAQLQTEYEVAQKEATIAAQRRMQLLTILASGLLALLLVGLYISYRNQQRSNHKLQALNEALAQKNDLLDKRNAENELLLKEIHHRVKNNLEVVSSLLALQGATVTDPEVLDAIIESQNRVHSMGIIHQKLYQGKNLAAIEMKDYFIHLSENILDSFGIAGRIQIECAMEELELDVDTAVPIGLIVNELLTNALKYAFPGKRAGAIRISLRESAPDTLCLEIADNGVGKAAGATARGTGFGSQLVQLLTSQLQGQISQRQQNGTAISLLLKKSRAA